jgi:hypothetical protein
VHITGISTHPEPCHKTRSQRAHPQDVVDSVPAQVVEVAGIEVDSGREYVDQVVGDFLPGFRADL